MQSRRQSLIEVFTNTFVGMLGSWAITFAALWLAERLQIQDRKTVVSACIVALCTVWSLVRGYAIRRRFNRNHNNKVVGVLPLQHGVQLEEESPPTFAH